MSNLSDIGNLMYLDLDIIKPGELTNNSEYLINVRSQMFKEQLLATTMVSMMLNSYAKGA